MLYTLYSFIQFNELYLLSAWRLSAVHHIHPRARDRWTTSCKTSPHPKFQVTYLHSFRLIPFVFADQVQRAVPQHLSLLAIFWPTVIIFYRQWQRQWDGDEAKRGSSSSHRLLPPIIPVCWVCICPARVIPFPSHHPGHMHKEKEEKEEERRQVWKKNLWQRRTALSQRKIKKKRPHKNALKMWRESWTLKAPRLMLTSKLREQVCRVRAYSRKSNGGEKRNPNRKPLMKMNKMQPYVEGLLDSALIVCLYIFVVVVFLEL